MNVGVAIDEGLASPTGGFVSPKKKKKTIEKKLKIYFFDIAAYTVFYGERSPMWIRVKATGNVGHGSRFVENTAVIKVIFFF